MLLEIILNCLLLKRKYGVAFFLLLQNEIYAVPHYVLFKRSAYHLQIGLQTGSVHVGYPTTKIPLKIWDLISPACYSLT